MKTYPPRICSKCKQEYTRLRGADACPACYPARSCVDCQQPYHNRDVHTLRCAGCMENKRKNYKHRAKNYAAKRPQCFNPEHDSTFYVNKREDEERKAKRLQKLHKLWWERWGHVNKNTA